MKRILKSRIFFFVLGLIIAGSCVYAYTYNASDIGYKSTNVEDALDDLYTTQNTTVTGLENQISTLQQANESLKSQVQTLTEENNNLSTSTVTPTKIRYIKIVITKTKSTPAQGTMQVAELKFYKQNGTAYTFPSTATVTGNHAGNSNQGLAKLIDNNTSTKYCAGSWGTTAEGRANIIIDLGQNKYLDLEEYTYYSFFTADDAESRDPSTWYIYGSEDGTNYFILDHKFGYTMTSARNTSAGTWKLESWKDY